MMDPVTVGRFSAALVDSVEDAVVTGNAVVVDAEDDAVDSLMVLLESERRPAASPDRLVASAGDGLVVAIYAGDEDVGDAEDDGVDSVVLLVQSERRPTTPPDRLVAPAVDELMVAAYAGDADEMLRDIDVGSWDGVEVVLAACEWTATGVRLFDAEGTLAYDVFVPSGWKDPDMSTGEYLAELLATASSLEVVGLDAAEDEIVGLVDELLVRLVLESCTGVVAVDTELTGVTSETVAGAVDSVPGVEDGVKESVWRWMVDDVTSLTEVDGEADDIAEMLEASGADVESGLIPSVAGVKNGVKNDGITTIGIVQSFDVEDGASLV